MEVWRLCRAPYVARTLEGVGGFYASGRWHRQGAAIVYTATAASLAALELLVHTDPATAPDDLRLVKLRIPESFEIEQITPADLPADWRTYPAPDALQAIGMEWLESARTPALLVPSAVVPQENNLLLNPRHHAIGVVTLLSDEPFSFDPRLLDR